MTQVQFSLRELRARKNVTQKDVAKEIGISDFTYYRIENDLKQLTSTKVEILIKLANFFGVGIEEIFLG